MAAGVWTTGGTLEVTGGKIEADYYGIIAQDGTVRISGGEVIGGPSGLARNTASTDVKIRGTINCVALSGGKVGEVLLNYGTTTEPHYAFYQDGQPVNLHEGKTLPNGTYAVAECHHEGVKASPNNDGIHSLKCLYCGYTKAANCAYSFSGNVGTCQACGDALTVSVSEPANLIFDGTAKTLEVAVKCGEEELTADTNYTVAYDNNTSAGRLKMA